MAPHEKTERRGMTNAFTSARPRGADAPAKLPVQRKKAVPITTKEAGWKTPAGSKASCRRR